MKKLFVMTGYVQRNTCNCGCVSNNAFWQDGGFGGSNHLSHLHHGIAKFLDELSGAGEGQNGEPHDVKVTVTIESLGRHEHRVMNRRAFSGLGAEDNRELREIISRPDDAPAEEPTVLEGKDEYAFTERKSVERKLPVVFLEDMHDRLLLVQRSGDLSKLDELMASLEHVINREP